MGTPHAGGGGVTWGKLALNLASIVKNTKADYLDVLERNSQWLEQQQVQYNSISSRYDTKFFYEIYETELPGGLKLLVCPSLLLSFSPFVSPTYCPAVLQDCWSSAVI